jgi:hypothetical protein
MNLRLAHQAEERYDCEASLVYIVSPRTVRTKKKKKKKRLKHILPSMASLLSGSPGLTVSSDELRFCTSSHPSEAEGWGKWRSA